MLPGYVRGPTRTARDRRSPSTSPPTGDRTGHRGRRVHARPPIDRLVFRLTANTPSPRPGGQRGRVTAATAGPAAPRAGRPRPARRRAPRAALLTLPLARSVPAGQQVTAHLEFTLRSARELVRPVRPPTPTRLVGQRAAAAGLGARRRLARRTVLQYTAETATSEAATSTSPSTAPARTRAGQRRRDDPADAVGRPAQLARHADRHGTSRRGRAVRDRDGDRSADDRGDRRRIGRRRRRSARPQARAGVSGAAGQPASGRPPFTALSTSPGCRSAAAASSTRARSSAGRQPVGHLHELAHMWFYGMVGDDQAPRPVAGRGVRDLRRGDRSTRLSHDESARSRLPGRVGRARSAICLRRQRGRPTTRSSTARAPPRCSPPRTGGRAGAFDAALRCYVNANAWRIAYPADLASRAAPGCPRRRPILRRTARAPCPG